MSNGIMPLHLSIIIAFAICTINLIVAPIMWGVEKKWGPCFERGWVRSSMQVSYALAFAWVIVTMFMLETGP